MPYRESSRERNANPGTLATRSLGACASTRSCNFTLPSLIGHLVQRMSVNQKSKKGVPGSLALRASLCYSTCRAAAELHSRLGVREAIRGGSECWGASRKQLASPVTCPRALVASQPRLRQSSPTAAGIERRTDNAGSDGRTRAFTKQSRAQADAGHLETA